MPAIFCHHGQKPKMWRLHSRLRLAAPLLGGVLITHNEAWCVKGKGKKKRPEHFQADDDFDTKRMFSPRLAAAQAVEDTPTPAPVQDKVYNWGRYLGHLDLGGGVMPESDWETLKDNLPFVVVEFREDGLPTQPQHHLRACWSDPLAIILGNRGSANAQSATSCSYAVLMHAINSVSIGKKEKATTENYRELYGALSPISATFELAGLSSLGVTVKRLQQCFLHADRCPALRHGNQSCDNHLVLTKEHRAWQARYPNWDHQAPLPQGWEKAFASELDCLTPGNHVEGVPVCLTPPCSQQPHPHTLQ